MAFIQIIEFKTKNIDAVNKLLDEFLVKTKGKRTASRAMMTKDRDGANTYLNIVEFPSYEEAMKNSSLPETAEIAGQMAALAEGPPIFRNLEVIRVEDMG
jgi:hypothetical protein